MQDCVLTSPPDFLVFLCSTYAVEHHHHDHGHWQPRVCASWWLGRTNCSRMVTLHQGQTRYLGTGVASSMSLQVRQIVCSCSHNITGSRACPSNRSWHNEHDDLEPTPVCFPTSEVLVSGGGEFLLTVSLSLVVLLEESLGLRVI